jgi:hypothetical protein
MEQFNDYGGKYPWWTLKFGEDSNLVYMNALQVRFLPALIVVDREGRVVTYDGVGDLRKYKEQAMEIW